MKECVWKLNIGLLRYLNLLAGRHESRAARIITRFNNDSHVGYLPYEGNLSPYLP